MPLPSEEADEAARLERRRLQSINWLVRYAGDDEPFADKLARLGLVATDNEIETAFAAAGRREFWENEVASLKLATTNGEFVGFDPSAVEPIRFETIEPEGPSLADRARALAEDALKAGDNKLHAALVRMQNGMEAGQNGQASLKIRATPYVWIGSKNIPPRPWVLGEWLLRKTAAAAIAPGGVGKSTFMASMTLSLITGRPLLGKEMHGGKQRVWIWNLKDPLDELQRSLEAGADHYGINSEDVADRLFVDSAMEGTGLCTAVEGREGFKLLAPVYEAITEELIDRKIDVLIVDPFVSSHEIDENDNSKVDSIAKAWGRVANAANCSIVLVHHTSKAGAGEVTVMSGRGAVSLTSACRCALVFNRMDDVTAASLGFDNAERRRYFTVSDDKHNRAPAG